MLTSRTGLLSLAMILGAATTVPAADPALGGASEVPLQGTLLPPSDSPQPTPTQLSPRLSALHQLGLQNITSISSHPLMGGPQGISVSELPAAAAYCESQRVDSFYAVRAGSTAPIPQIELAHPSHVPGVPGSRPFVSNGPLSPRPGTRRLEPGMLSPPANYPYLSATPAVPTQPAAATQPSPQSPSAAPQELRLNSAPIVSTTSEVARFLASLEAAGR